jgi:hypothetical protein
MPRVGFEPMIPVFEQAKPVHALHSTATVIGIPVTRHTNIVRQTKQFLFYNTLVREIPEKEGPLTYRAA